MLTSVGSDTISLFFSTVSLLSLLHLSFRASSFISLFVFSCSPVSSISPSLSRLYSCFYLHSPTPLFISFNSSLGLQMSILLHLPASGLSPHLCNTPLFFLSLPPHPSPPSVLSSLLLSTVHKLFGIYSMWPDARFPLGASFPGDGAGGLGCVTSRWRAERRVGGWG